LQAGPKAKPQTKRKPGQNVNRIWPGQVGRPVDLFLIGPAEKKYKKKYPQRQHFHFTTLLFSGLKLSQSVCTLLFRHIYQFVCSADVAG